MIFGLIFVAHCSSLFNDSEDNSSLTTLLKASYSFSHSNPRFDVIVSIIQENADSVPEYIRPLSLENYFSEQVTGKYAIKTIRTAWKTSRKSFAISRRNNELRYNAGATYEADRLMKELPETLEARKSREWVVMNLEEAKDFFNIDFRGPWFSFL